MKEIIKKIVPGFFIDWYHFSLAFLGAFLYGFPSRKLIVIGITGTNGKSTVVEMCHQVLKEAGLKVASLSSIRFKINDKEWPNTLKMTMPGRLKLQRFLRKAADAGCQYAVLEVTSEGIKQHRHRFIDFDVAALTNLTPEHIESHGSFEKYREAKGQLFRFLKRTVNREQRTISIVNLDDGNAKYFLQFSADKKWGYKIKSKIKNQKSKIQIKNLKIIEAKDIVLEKDGLSFKLQATSYKLHLLGEFNIYNALAAICVGLSQGIGLKTIRIALERIRTVSGRMETVVEKPFKVVVDYAHTPDSLRKVYETLNPKPYTLTPKLICVLGSCGGGRDRWKRPEMGKIAAQYCNQIILTNEDPYDEPPEEILREIAEGIKTYNLKPKTYNLIIERREAIRRALTLARHGDTVIITGKGSEPWMCVAGGRKIPWDDRKIVKEELKALARFDKFSLNPL